MKCHSLAWPHRPRPSQQGSARHGLLTFQIPCALWPDTCASISMRCCITLLGSTLALLRRHGPGSILCQACQVLTQAVDAPAPVGRPRCTGPGIKGARRRGHVP